MKAILIVDMPMSCEECICSDISTDYVYCQADTYHEMGSTRKRPSWCHLKPVSDIIPITWIEKYADYVLDDDINWMNEWKPYSVLLKMVDDWREENEHI